MRKENEMREFASLVSVLGLLSAVRYKLGIAKYGRDFW